MRILLAQNSPYFPAHGGGGKSNRLLMEALAARGHVCRAVARIPALGPAETERYAAELAARGVRPAFPEEGIAAFDLAGVEVRVVTAGSLRASFAAQVEDFQPDAILTSTDDPAQLLLEAALRIAPRRVVYLARATLALPFGPDCAFPSEAMTARIRAAAGVVGVSEYVAGYIRRYAGIPATHVPISLLEAGDWSRLGRFDNEFVTMANPCAVKGIAIFLALADACPETAFAAAPTWGTNGRDRAALALRPNVRLLDAVDDIGVLLARTRVLLAPSLWAEARSRIVVEAMLRGVPVLASDVGGIAEAKMGVPYLLPVNPITRYRTRLDERMVPEAEVPVQNIGPWREALARLLGDRGHYEEIAAASQAAARSYAEGLSVGPFEALLERMVRTGGSASANREIGVPREALPGEALPAPGLPRERQSPDWRLQPDALTPDKRRLLALLLRKRAPAAAWFPAVGQASWPACREGAEGARLFCFPYAGGGAAAFAGWRLPGAAVCPVRLPGRESRAAEAPFERMGALVEALAAAIEPYLERPFAFFGHSMGADVAFELARFLRKRGLPQPKLLVASGARAPQFRLHHTPPPDPSEEQFLAELRRLGGIPAEALEDPAVLRAILPSLTADAALYRRYVYAEDAPLSLPLRAYGGDADPNILPEHLQAWEKQTTARFRVRLFAGGHFFLHQSRAEVLAALAADLEEAC
jgi:surfactin synthase thioesterase subunit/glycosyltransferase involved in cell wall biosynthesis